MMREYKRARRCERRIRVLGCRQPLAGQCQYCARGFCANHGDRFDDRQEVCHRDRCQARKADVDRHHAFLRDARARNADGRCGMPECAAAPVTHCERCGPRFCVAHLQETLVMALHQGERGSDVLRMCAHCLSRVNLWGDD